MQNKQVTFIAKIIAGSCRFLIMVVFYTLCGVLLSSLFLVPLYIRSLPELALWHTQRLSSEFTANSGLNSFKQYLAMEEKLFAELETKISNKVSTSAKSSISRFYKDSRSYPGSAGVNWNRSFILEADAAEPAILLVHGLSDSPYALRALGQHLHDRGAFVLGLSAPSGLLDTTWQDMAAAVALAMQYLEKSNPERPVYIIGYSTGAALALYYTLLTLTDAPLKTPAGLIFISPAIGVAKVAALAHVNEKLSYLPGFEKMAWTDILPEYNPYKYNSFTANAGNQVYQLTRSIKHDLARMQKTGNLDVLPPIISFQSIVDATVSISALIDNLFQRLTRPGHEIVFFDLNRSVDLGALVKNDPISAVRRLQEDNNPSVTVSLVTNLNHGSQVVLHQKKAGKSAIETTELHLSWPQGIWPDRYRQQIRRMVKLLSCLNDLVAP